MSRIASTALFLLLAGCAPSPSPEKESTPLVEEVAQETLSRCRFVDSEGRVVIGKELDIQDGFDFEEGLAGIKNHKGRLGYVDRRGKLVIPYQFSDGTSHREGLAGVLENGMCGYIDLSGELVVPLRYDSVTNFRDGWGLVRRDSRWTFVNDEGEEIGALFLAAESFSEGLAAVAPLQAEKGDDGPRYGFIDTEGKMVLAAEFRGAEPFSEGLAAVRPGQKWGYIDRSGEIVVEARFDLAGPFHEGLAPVQLGTKMGYVDSSGAMVIEPRFEADRFQSDADEKPVFVGRFVDGLAAVRQALGTRTEGGWGFIDRQGEWVISPIYEDAYYFSEGLAAVRFDGRWGYLDTSGTIVISTSFEKASIFSEGLALVCSQPNVE